MKKSTTRRKITKKKAPKAKKIGKAELRIDGNIWPLERDVLYRPDRMKYVRKLIKPDGCVFCRASEKAKSFDTLCVYKSSHSMIVMNKYPYNSGHVLVIPRRHVSDLLNLSSEEYHDLQDTISLAMKVLSQAYEPGGFNLGLNQGAVAGAGIPEHIHYHMVPRWYGDLNFFPLIAETKVLVESLEQTFEKLCAILKSYEQKY